MLCGRARRTDDPVLRQHPECVECSARVHHHPARDRLLRVARSRRDVRGTDRAMRHGASWRRALPSRHHRARLGREPAPADCAHRPSVVAATAIADNPSSIMRLPEPIPHAGRNNAWVRRQLSINGAATTTIAARKTLFQKTRTVRCECP